MLAAAAAALVQGFAGSARPSRASLGSARSAVSMATGLAAGVLAGALGYAAFFWIAAGLALLAVPALFWATRAEAG